MNPKLQQIFSVLFLVLVLATVVVYFATDKNMKITWIMSILAIISYFLYRFSRR